MPEPYNGRLAWDHDAGLHVAEDGRYVVNCPEHGWRYREEGDPTHFERYHKQWVPIKQTTPADDHHFGPTPDDDHYDHTNSGVAIQFVRMLNKVVPGLNLTAHYAELKFDDDEVAAKVTSHTEAW